MERRYFFKRLIALLAMPALCMGQIRFEERVVYEGDIVHSAQAVDYNGDGLKDLIFTGEGGVNLLLAPDFDLHRICATPEPLKPNSFHSNVMDVDGDGDMDFLGENKGLYWLECPDQLLVDDWELHWITKEFTGIHCITIHDVDEDGHDDIVVNNYWHKRQRRNRPNQYPASVVWYDVPDDPGNTEAWNPYILADGDALGGSHYISFADVNEDGHDEALLGSVGNSFWWGNYFAYWTREADVYQPWKKKKLRGRHKGASHLYGADLTGDGKTDFVGSLGHGKGIMLFEAPDFIWRWVDNELIGTHAFDISDVDDDGDVDLVVCAYESAKAQWFENNGKGVFTQHILSDDQQAYDIEITDLDSDGDLDVVIAGYKSKNIALYFQE